MLRILLVLSLLLPTRAFALDLVEVLKLAEQYDAEFQASRAAYQAEVENRNISGGEMLPQVSFNAFASETQSKTTNSTSVSRPNGDSDFGSHGYSLALSQVLYDKSLFDSADADTSRAAQALAQLEASRQQLYVRVAESYFALASAFDAVRLAKAEREAIGRQLEQSTERFRAGLIPRTDVTEAQARYDLALADVIVSENDLNNAGEAMRLLIGETLTDIGTLEGDIPLALPQPDDIEQWQQQAMDNNLELIASKHALRAAEQEHDSAKGEHYPTVSLNAEHSFNSAEGSSISNTFSGRDLEENTLSLNMNIPIYSGGSTSATIRQKLAERDLARAQYEQQLRLTAQRVRSAYLNVKASISRVQALKQALVSAKLATEATQLSYEAGKRTSVDVLLAQREQYASENAYSTARYEYLLNLLRLKQAGGILEADDLVQTNRYIIQPMIDSLDQPQAQPQG